MDDDDAPVLHFLPSLFILKHGGQACQRSYNDYSTRVRNGHRPSILSAASPMITASTSISLPVNFSLWRTIYSHGWCSLPPFSVDKQAGSLRRMLALSGGTTALCNLSEGRTKILVRIRSATRLSKRETNEVKRLIGESLRLGEDFSEFYRETSRYSRFRWIGKTGSGRLLRAPTVFEDVVKMMCTTNCSWSLTESMVGNLTRRLGEKLDGSYGFPSPQALAGVSESYIRRSIRAGYRSPYLVEFARAVASGTLDVESWRHSPLSTEALFEKVTSVKGIGPYAAGNILRLLGRYDYLALDSWVRKKFYEVHHRGRKVSDSTIERHYASFGKWRGLFFWLDMTKDWYAHKFPF